MAKEIAGVSPTGTLYARVRKKSSGAWWNTNSAALEAYSASNYAYYVVSMTEEGNSGVYVADFPTTITTGGTYEYFVHRTLGSAAESDVVVATGTIDWSGTVSISSASGSMSGSEFREYCRGTGGFTRTDKETQFYECVTDAIQQLRRDFNFDEAEVDATSTDTIATLGDYKLAIETDLGLLNGILLLDDDTGTPLNKKSKDEFDRLYPSISVETDRGYPQDFCIYAGSIYIGPIPDRVAYTYRLTYSRRAGTIVSTTSGVPFTNVYRELLKDLTLAKLYNGLDEPALSDKHLQLFIIAWPGVMRRENLNAGRGIAHQEIYSI